MCLLTFFPEGVLPDTDTLAEGAKYNDDGHGYAIVCGERIITGHSMDFEQLLEEFSYFRNLCPEGPALFHSRMGTHGKNTIDNCHPFWLGKDRRTVIAHNGIFSAAVQPDKGDIRSDTRILAEDFLPKHPEFSPKTKKGRKRLANWMGTYNKVVILTTDPTYNAGASGHNAFILNEHMGEWEDGIWYSNDWFRGTSGARFWGTYAATPYSSSSDYSWMDSDWYKELKADKEAADKESVRDCPICYTEGSVNFWSRICDFCGCCIDCEQVDTACQCYIPPRKESTTIGHEVAIVADVIDSEPDDQGFVSHKIVYSDGKEIVRWIKPVPTGGKVFSASDNGPDDSDDVQ